MAFVLVFFHVHAVLAKNQKSGSFKLSECTFAVPSRGDQLESRMLESRLCPKAGMNVSERIEQYTKVKKLQHDTTQ